MTDLLTGPVQTEAEGLALERELAIEAATSDIQCHTDRDGDWWLLDSADDGDADWVARAVRYLEWRGLIERDPENSERIKIRGA